MDYLKSRSGCKGQSIKGLGAARRWMERKEAARAPRCGRNRSRHRSILKSRSREMSSIILPVFCMSSPPSPHTFPSHVLPFSSPFPPPPFLSIRENILYGKPGASPKEVEEAAKAANAHAFISELPEGYDTQVQEERGQGGGWRGGRPFIMASFHHHFITRDGMCR